MNQLLEIRTLENADLRELVLEAQAGDRAAFGQLVERFERAVYAMAMRRLGNDAEAQELTIEPVDAPLCTGSSPDTLRANVPGARTPRPVLGVGGRAPDGSRFLFQTALRIEPDGRHLRLRPTHQPWRRRWRAICREP